MPETQDASPVAEAGVTPDTTTQPAGSILAGEQAGGEKTAAATPTWMEQLDSSLKGNKELSQYQKLNDLGKAYIDLKGKTEGTVRVPGEKATPEETAAFRKAVGVPEKPEGYEVVRPEKMPEGMQYYEALEGSFKHAAHALGLTPAQMKGIYDMYNKHEIDRYTAIDKYIAENRENATNELKNLWKGNAYEENRSKATKIFFDTLTKLQPPKEIGGAEGIMKRFKETGFGDDPAMVWYFSKLYDRMNIDSFGESGAPQGSSQKEKGMLDFNMQK